MPKTSRKAPTADEIAEMASRGEDVSSYFTNKFAVVRPVHRVNVGLTQGMLRELDERTARMTISRQAVVKTWLVCALRKEREHRRRSKRAGLSQGARRIASLPVLARRVEQAWTVLISRWVSSTTSAELSEASRSVPHELGDNNDEGSWRLPIMRT